MRAILYISVVLTAFLFSHKVLATEGKAVAGIDLSNTILNRSPEVVIGYAISSKWSVDVTTPIHKDIFRKGYNKEELLHYQETGHLVQEKKDSEVGSSAGLKIVLRHWTDVPFKGPYLSGGLSIREDGIPALLTGAGYGFRIWRHLKGSICYETTVEQTQRKREERISIILYYRF